MTNRPPLGSSRRLSDALAPQIDDRTRARGAEYAAAGAVTWIEEHAGLISAVVRGKEPYDVWMEVRGRLLQSSCTCPYFVDRLEICKHVWAAILEAEQRGLLRMNAGDAAGATLEPLDVDDLDEDLDEPWLFPDLPIPAPARGRPAASPGPRAAPPARGGPAAARGLRAVPPAWQLALEAIAATAHRPLPASRRVVPGQLLFVIDIDASRAAGVLVMELMTRDRKISGEWGKPRPGRVSAADVHSLAPGSDREILERLLGASPDVGEMGYAAPGELGRFRLHGSLLTELLPRMCADARCVARTADPAQDRTAVAQPALGTLARWQQRSPKPSPPVLLPLAFADGGPWRFEPRIHRDEDARAYRIEGTLSRGGERMDASEPLLVTTDHVLVTRTHVARLDHRNAFTWLAALRRSGPLVVPFEARPSLVDAMLAQPLPVESPPDDLRLTIEQGTPEPSMRLRPGQWRGRLEADVTMRYGDLEVPLTAPSELLRTIETTRAIRRDRDAEWKLAEGLQRLGFRTEWSQRAQGGVPQIDADRLPRVVRTLLAAGWHVEASGIKYRQPGGVQLGVSSGIDWFDVEGHVDYDGRQVPLPAILAAARRGDAFVTLDDGTQGLLPDEWLKTHGALARMGSPEGNVLRFTRPQTALLDALLAGQPAVTADEAFARARAELASFDRILPADPPAEFAGNLREYQREGLGWLLFLRRFGFGGCLADDMGLGKTVMVLALLARVRADRAAGERRPSLVVAPRSLVFNWRQEAARFTPDLRVVEYTGTGRSAVRDALAEYDLVLTTYGTLRRDAVHLNAVPFDSVVLDEAQAIKNAASASAKAARLLPARHRLALSGTPVENHLGELWSLFEFLNPGVLGSAAAFAGAAGRTLDEETVALLSRGLRPFILRRTKDQVAPELPAKTEQTVYCELERPQRALYDELRDHYRQTLLARYTDKGSGRAKLQVLEALLRLRQAACHPGLIDRKRTGDASAKLEVLVPHLLQAVEEGHKTLVFSQFTSLLAILRSTLDRAGLPYEYLDGRTRDREPRVTRFQTDPECRLFLISLKAGGVGLNLTAAEYVFLLDPWWNPAVEAQAIDRTHRIGQTRHVFAYRLIAKDTVEERVLQLQQHKRSLADAILSADESLLRTLRREDLELLLS